MKGDAFKAYIDSFWGFATEDEADPGTRVRIWNLPRKKNIHRDLQRAFRGFPGLVSISPAVIGNEKTREPVCRGFAFVCLASKEAANRYSLFLYLYYVTPISQITKGPNLRWTSTISKVILLFLLIYGMVLCFPCLSTCAWFQVFQCCNFCSWY